MWETRNYRRSLLRLVFHLNDIFAATLMAIFCRCVSTPRSTTCPTNSQISRRAFQVCGCYARAKRTEMKPRVSGFCTNFASICIAHVIRASRCSLEQMELYILDRYLKKKKNFIKPHHSITKQVKSFSA